MRYSRVIIFVMPLFLISACATLSREDCIQGAWFDLGVRDGRAGETFNQLSRHQQACREYGIQIDAMAYSAGREEGLKSYCQLENAVEMGLHGHRYQSVCPPDIDVLFRRLNYAAYDVYQSKESLEKLDDELFDKENHLLDSKLTDEKRSKIRIDIRQLDRERQRLRDELYSNERRLEHLINQRYRSY